jgi:hypothetical protein
MGKRSTFERVPRDFYPTPREAVVPLLRHLPMQAHFIEPCAGDGALVEHLSGFGHHCAFGVDIEPRWPMAREGDARTMRYNTADASHFITNPPWSRATLHPIIENLSRQLPTWLLFDADWMHTRQAAPYLPLLRKIVSVGRVKWIPDSPFTGKDNCADQFYSPEPLGTAEVAERRVMAEIGSERLRDAILRYIERHHRGVNL